MLTSLLQYSDLGMFLLRLAVAVIFIYHGVSKFKMRNWMLGVGIVESIAALMVLSGLWLQLGALVLAVIMLGAIYFKVSKWKIPFSIQTNTGWEFDFILLFASIAILLTGGGSIGI